MDTRVEFGEMFDGARWPVVFSQAQWLADTHAWERRGLCGDGIVPGAIVRVMEVEESAVRGK